MAPLRQRVRYPRRVIAGEAPGQAEMGVAGAGPLDHLKAQPAAGAAHGRLPCGVDAPSKTGQGGGARDTEAAEPVMVRRGRRRRSEEHTSELQSLMRISYAVFCLKKKKRYKKDRTALDKKNTGSKPDKTIKYTQQIDE